MRYAARIEYNGTAFCGWQRQTKHISVQAEVEKAFSQVADRPIQIVCAGRTDTGVHGIGQIVHFDAEVERPIKAWLMGANTALPADISINMVKLVSHDFHARYSAIARSYRYIIINARARSALMTKRAAWVYHPLDIGVMQAGANYLLGEHDFSAFRAAGCQAKSPVRTIHSLSIQQKGDFIYLDISANAFLHNMVRIIIGNLLKVGKGEAQPEWIGEVLAGQDRTIGGMTAPPHGLYFIGPHYPEAFAVPLPDYWPEYSSN